MDSQSSAHYAKKAAYFFELPLFQCPGESINEEIVYDSASYLFVTFALRFPHHLRA
jgi:hypothetical protein